MEKMIVYLGDDGCMYPKESEAVASVLGALNEGDANELFDGRGTELSKRAIMRAAELLTERKRG